MAWIDNAGRTRYACNFKFHLYKHTEITDKSFLRRQWRQAWIYGEETTFFKTQRMPLPGRFLRKNFPRPSPLPNTAHYRSQAPPLEPDRDLRDDGFGDSAIGAENDEGGETSGFGTSGGRQAAPTTGVVIFRSLRALEH